MKFFQDVDTTKRQVLLLLQRSDGMRLYRLVDADEAVPACDQSCEIMLRTQPIPAELLLSRDLHAIAERVPLSTGGIFKVDAHCTWFTEDEVGDLLSGRPVRWLGGRVPKLAPY